MQEGFVSILIFFDAILREVENFFGNCLFDKIYKTKRRFFSYISIKNQFYKIIFSIYFCFVNLENNFYDSPIGQKSRYVSKIRVLFNPEILRHPKKLTRIFLQILCQLLLKYNQIHPNIFIA